jgi:hypothetical protein
MTNMNFIYMALLLASTAIATSPMKCGPNQVDGCAPCGPAKTCQDVRDPPPPAQIMCSFICTRACVCIQDHVRNDDGHCVPEASCYDEEQ